MPAPQPAAGSRRRRRAPWGSVSREQVVEAGLRAVKSQEPDRLTIRSLAADLGVAPMTLYRHVRDKDDLLDEVVDRLLAASWQPTGESPGWRAWLVECADRLRQLIVTQPAARHVYLRHPVVSPAATQRMEAMLGTLRRAGASEGEAERAYAALQTYTIGFAALEASRAGWSPPGDDERDLAHRLVAVTSREQFEQGLAFLLDGIERHTGATNPP